MKRTLLILANVFFSLVGYANVETTIDGLKYSLDTDAKTASVIQNHYRKQEYNIPRQIDYDGVSYSVTSIGDRAFYYREELMAITIPNSVETIGDEAFYNCTSLRNVVIPNSVTSIGSGAFNWCRGLVSVTIPNSVTTIGENAFRACTSLLTLEIPNSVTTIGSAAFQHCESLVYVSLPKTLTYLGDNLFRACIKLSSVTVPDSVKTIGNGAFSDCSSLVNVNISGSVKTIGSEAFQNCSSLYHINIPNSVTNIGGAAFYSSGLLSITLPNSLTSIEESTFASCSNLSVVKIPGNVKVIGSEAFANCYNLDDVYCYTQDPSSVPTAKNAFGNSYYNYHSFSVYVFPGMKEAFKNSEDWQIYNISEISEEEAKIVGINDAVEAEHDIRILSSNGKVIIKANEAGLPVSVYSVNGSLVASDCTCGNETTLDIDGKGVYVVRVGKSKAVKVRL